MPDVFFSSWSPGARSAGAGACRVAAGLTALTTLAAAAPPAAHQAAQALAASSARATFRSGAFAAVSSVSATDAWAVGAIQPPPGRPVHTLVAHWNGTRWSRVPSPNPGPHGESSLRGVSAISASDVWAVGDSGTPPGLSSLVLRWNGTRWTRVPSPNPAAPAGGTDLNGVSAVSASGAWAVGSYGTIMKTLVLRWNGTHWAQVASPSPGGRQGSMLLGVASVPNAGAWAVGWTASNGGPAQTLVLRWNGTGWTRVPSPSAPTGSSELNGVSAISASNAWAAGDVSRNQVSTTLVLRWTGTRWTRVASPGQGASFLYGVSDISVRDALAVGTGSAGSLALRWNGKSWVIS